MCRHSTNDSFIKWLEKREGDQSGNYVLEAIVYLRPMETWNVGDEENIDEFPFCLNQDVSIPGCSNKIVYSREFFNYWSHKNNVWFQLFWKFGSILKHHT
jgi:hypothetical protein